MPSLDRYHPLLKKKVHFRNQNNGIINVVVSFDRTNKMLIVIVPRTLDRNLQL